MGSTPKQRAKIRPARIVRLTPSLDLDRRGKIAALVRRKFDELQFFFAESQPGELARLQRFFEKGQREQIVESIGVYRLGRALITNERIIDATIEDMGGQHSLPESTFLQLVPQGKRKEIREKIRKLAAIVMLAHTIKPHSSNQILQGKTQREDREMLDFLQRDSSFALVELKKVLVAALGFRADIRFIHLLQNNAKQVGKNYMWRRI